MPENLLGRQKAWAFVPTLIWGLSALQRPLLKHKSRQDVRRVPTILAGSQGINRGFGMNLGIPLKRNHSGCDRFQRRPAMAAASACWRRCPRKALNATCIEPQTPCEQRAEAQKFSARPYKLALLPACSDYSFELLWSSDYLTSWYGYCSFLENS